MYDFSMYRYVQYTFQCKKRAENRKMKNSETGSDRTTGERTNGPDRTTVLHGDFEGSGTGFMPWLSGELVSQLRATYFSLRLGRNS